MRDNDNVFCHYQILSKIGQGGMGAVYKVKDLRIKRILALKTIIPSQITPKIRRRFFVEAEALAKLTHPNIVRLYTIDQHQGRPFFTMDHIEGVSLEKLARQKRLDISQTIELVRKIAEAIHYAHQNNIIHRDLKPGNILIDSDNNPYITDFGLAKILDHDKRLTATGAAVGTFAYMSPEQARGEKNIDARSDVFSLGTIFYELLTRQRPFKGESEIEIVTRILEIPPIAPRKLNPDISRDAELVCLGALEKKTKARYQSAWQFAADLQKLQQGGVVHARTKRLHTIVRNHWLYPTMITALLILVVGLFFFRNTGTDKQRDMVENFVLSLESQRPLTPEQRLEIARQLQKQRRYDKSLAILDEVLAQKTPMPLVVQTYRQKVIVLSEIKEYNTAIALYEKFLVGAEMSQQVLIAIARAYLYQKPQAFDFRQLADIAHNPEVPALAIEAEYILGLRAYDDGNYREALARFKKARENLEQRSAEVSFTIASLDFALGVCCFRENQYDFAIRYLRNIDDHSPDFSKALYYLGLCYHKLANVDSGKKREHLHTASGYFSRALQSQPNRGKYYTGYGYVQKELSNFRVAHQSFIRALDLDPQDFHALAEFTKLSFHDVFLHHGHAARLFYYLRKADDTPRIKIFRDEARRILHKYYSSYLRQRPKSIAQSPRFFIKQLHSSSANIYSSALRALSVFNGQDVDALLQDLLDNVDLPGESRTRLAEARLEIQQMRQRQQRFAMYYAMARLYLEDDWQIKRQLTRDEKTRKATAQTMQTILFDTQEEIAVRYLAAWSLITLGFFEIIEAQTNSSDPWLAVVCATLLRERYFFSTGFHWGNIERLIQDPREDARLCAVAGYIAFDETPNSVREILLNYLDSPSPVLRSYAYYHLLQIVKQDDKLFHRQMLRALNDTPAVRNWAIRAMKNSNPNPYIEKLWQIFRDSQDLSLKMLLLSAILYSDKKYKWAKMVALDTKQPFMLRLFALMGSILPLAEGKGQWQSSSLFATYAKIRDSFATVNELYDDSDPILRAYVIYIAACFGALPKNFGERLATEQDERAKAFILLALTEKSVLSVSLQGMTTIQAYHELHSSGQLEQLLRSESPIVVTAAHLVKAFRSEERDLNEIYGNFQHSNDIAARKGIALGLYRRIALHAFSAMLFKNITGKTIRPETVYKEALLQNLRTSQSLQKSFLESLNRALQLYPHPEFYYQRGLLFHSQGQFMLARRDLLKTIELEKQDKRATKREIIPAYRNLLAFLQTLLEINAYDEIDTILQNGEFYHSEDTEIQLFLINLYKKRSDIDSEEYQCRLLCANEVIDAHLVLASVFYRKQQYQKAARYLQYFEYRTYSHSQNHYLQQYPELVPLFKAVKEKDNR